MEESSVNERSNEHGSRRKGSSIVTKRFTVFGVSPASDEAAFIHWNTALYCTPQWGSDGLVIYDSFIRDGCDICNGSGSCASCDSI